METISIPSSCPVCGSPYMAYVRHVPTRRTKRNIPLYVCYLCLSFSNPSDYHEDEQQLQRALTWHQSVADRNAKAAVRLLTLLQERVRPCRALIEIGCGIGTLLKEAEKLSMAAVGYDISSIAGEYGRSTYGVNIRTGLWNRHSSVGKFDLLLCISVMEHLEKPRLLFEEIAQSCRVNRAYAFVSVPFLNEDRWPFIRDPDPYKPGTPFFDNDVHVTHFSTKGLKILAEECGAVSLEFVDAGLWVGPLMKFHKEM